MKRLVPLALLTLIIAGGIPAATSSAADAGRPAFIYGDSVIIQAQQYLKPGYTQRAIVGASPCGYYFSGQMQADAATNPSAVILIFMGLYDGYWCEEQTGTPYQAYLWDFQVVKSIFPNAKVYAVMPPANQPPAFDNTYVAQAAQAAQSSGVIPFDARTPLNGYARASDGLHLQAAGNQKLAQLISMLYKGGVRTKAK